jgi:hypothetical protein
MKTEKPKWLRVQGVRGGYGISKGQLYRLLKTGLIKTASLKTDSANSRGVRLIERASLEAFLETQVEKGGPDA